MRSVFRAAHLQIFAIFVVASSLAVSVRAVEPTDKARASAYVTSHVCAECHATQYQNWRGSHHQLAMQRADRNTVLGDFDNARFESHGVETRFLVRDGGFIVNTEGPDGKHADFRVKYTFGVEPLPQYLIELPADTTIKAVSSVRARLLEYNPVAAVRVDVDSTEEKQR